MYMKIRLRYLSVILPLVLIATPLYAVYAAAPKAGATCKKVGLTATYAGKKFTCIKSGKKLVWNKGVKVLVAKPVATPTGSASAVPKVSATPTGYTMQQVATNNRAASCWTVIDGWVYNLTSWIDSHPGGAGTITSMCGIDSTAAFNAQHLSDASVAQVLASYRIGIIKK